MVRRKETHSREERSKVSKRLNEHSQSTVDLESDSIEDEFDIFGEDDLNKIVEYYEENEFEKLPDIIKSSQLTKIKRTLLSLGRGENDKV